MQGQSLKGELRLDLVPGSRAGLLVELGSQEGCIPDGGMGVSRCKSRNEHGVHGARDWVSQGECVQSCDPSGCCPGQETGTGLSELFPIEQSIALCSNGPYFPAFIHI